METKSLAHGRTNCTNNCGKVVNDGTQSANNINTNHLLNGAVVQLGMMAWSATIIIIRDAFFLHSPSHRRSMRV